MTQLSLSIPVDGQPFATEGPKVGTSLTSIQSVINGGLDSGNLSASAAIAGTQLASAAALKASQIGGGGGAVNIATSESRTNTAYGTLATPDQVSVTLPANGLIAVAYQATWQASAASNAGSAAIFIGTNQLKRANEAANPAVQETVTSNSATTDNLLATYLGGLAGAKSNTAYLGDVTTGQLIGTDDPSSTSGFFGPCYIFAAAGTYTVSIQFKASSGSVTAKNRKLWVWTMGF